MSTARGKVMCGDVERVGRTFIATTFTEIRSVPLFPVASYILLPEGDDGHQAIPIRMHWKSVLVGYLRSWGPIVAFFTLMMGFSATNLEEAEGWLTVGVICAALAAAAFLHLGRLSRTQRAIRLVHAQFAEHPVDVTLLDDTTRRRLEARLHSFLDERGASMVPKQGYRQSANADQSYRALAMSPAVKDRDYLAAALTLAQLDASLSVGAPRAALSKLHQQIWSKLRTEHPDVLNLPRDAGRSDNNPWRALVLMLAIVAIKGGIFCFNQDAEAKLEREELRESLSTFVHNAPAQRVRESAELALFALELEPDAAPIER